ncbi:plasmid replication protein, CyRepA1 family [Geminocystis sp. CENA526]
MLIEKGKIVTLPLKQNSVSPEFATSAQGSKAHGGLNQPNGQNFSSSQNLTISQEILTKKRPLRTDISFSYCAELINKPVKNSDKAKTNFHSMSGNVDNIIDIYRKGFAVSPFHYTDNHRNTENATVAGLLIVDIDNQEWVEEVGSGQWEVGSGNNVTNEDEEKSNYPLSTKNYPLQEIVDGNNNNGCENETESENDWGNELHNENGDNNGNKPENGNNDRQIVKRKVYKHQLTLEEYQSIDFCRKYTFAITTCSHTETWHRFRVFLPLPMDIDKTTYEVALRHLNGILRGAIDINATNPSVGFYGNSNGILYKSDDFQALDYNWLSELQPEVDKIKRKRAKQERKLAKKIAKSQKKLAQSATAKDIIDALSYVSSEDYDTWTKVGFALHHTFNGSEEGLEIYDNWSSQAHNYNGRKAIESKWRSFSKSRTNKPLTIATVFKLAIDRGYKPPRKIRRRLDARHYFEEYKTFSYPISLECHKNYNKGEITHEINHYNSDYSDNEIEAGISPDNNFAGETTNQINPHHSDYSDNEIETGISPNNNFAGEITHEINHYNSDYSDNEIKAGISPDNSLTNGVNISISFHNQDYLNAQTKKKNSSHNDFNDGINTSIDLQNSGKSLDYLNSQTKHNNSFYNDFNDGINRLIDLQITADNLDDLNRQTKNNNSSHNNLDNGITTSIDLQITADNLDDLNNQTNKNNSSHNDLDNGITTSIDPQILADNQDYLNAQTKKKNSSDNDFNDGINSSIDLQIPADNLNNLNDEINTLISPYNNCTGEITSPINHHNSDYLSNEIETGISPNNEFVKSKPKKGYFPEEIIAQIPRQGLVFIQGDMGTGKTYLAEKIVKEFKAQGKYVLSPDSTRSLCQQSANRYGIYYKTHDDTTPIEKLRSQGIKTTYDSFAKYKDESPDCIIFDEILSSIYHLLLGDTELKHNREEVLYAVRNVVKNCIDKGGLVICLDEMLVDFCIDLMKDFAGGIEPFIVVNHHRNNNYETHQLLNPDDPKKLLFTMPTLGLKPFYCCDSQKEVISLYEELSATFPDKVFKHIHQGNANLPENKELLSNPTVWLQNNRCDGLIVSPTIVCGFSIEGNFFDAVIGNFCGVLPVNQCRQMLRRIRSDIPRYVYASSHGLSYANVFDFQEIADKAISKKKTKLDLLKLSSLIAKSILPLEYMKVLHSMIDPETGKWNNIELITQSKYIGFINGGKANYQENIFHELRDSGSTIIYGYSYDKFVLEFVEVGFTEESLQEHSNKDFKGIVKAHHQKVISHQAESISVGDSSGHDLESAQYVLKNRYAQNPKTHQPLYTEAEIAGAQKFIYQDLLPSVELTADFIKEYLLEDKTKLRSIERYFWLNNFSLLKKKETIKALNWLNNSRRLVYLENNHDDLLLEIHLLKVLEVQKFIDLDGCFTRKDKCIKSFFKRALKHKQDLKDYFNIEVTKNSNPIIVLKKLLKSIGIKLQSKVRKVNKVNTRVYVIDRSYLHDEIRQSVLTSYQMRNMVLKTVKGKMKKISENFEDNKMTETLIKSPLDADNNRYKNDSISYNNKAHSVAINKVTTEELKEGENFNIQTESKEGNKMAETVINSDFNPDDNRYENDSISYNNPVHFVATQEDNKY